MLDGRGGRVEVVERAKGLPRLHIHLAHHIECPPRILVTESGMRGPARRVRRRRVAHRQDHRLPSPRPRDRARWSVSKSMIAASWVSRQEGDEERKGREINLLSCLERLCEVYCKAGFTPMLRDAPGGLHHEIKKRDECAGSSRPASIRARARQGNSSHCLSSNTEVSTRCNLHWA